MSREPSTYVVKIGEQGLLTIAMPEMAGRYMVVEQRDGRLIVSPFDLSSDNMNGAIARQGANVCLLGTEAGGFPQA